MSSFKKIAMDYKRKININVLPLKGKRPMILWEKWQSEIQTEADIKNMNWNNATGIGGIQGVNNWRCFDIDKVEDFEIIELMLNELGLPDNYNWVVQSGSGVGFHIYFRSASQFLSCEKGISPHPSPHPKGEGEEPPLPNYSIDENLFDTLGGEKAVYKFSLKPVSPSESRGDKESYCDHIELRWKDCQTALPPSMHESGGIYNFYFDEPQEEPKWVKLEKVFGCIEKFCLIETLTLPTSRLRQASPALSQRERERTKQHKTNGEKAFYDKARLESALEFLSERLPEGSYNEWYKIGFALVPLGEKGKEIFTKMSLDNPNYKDTEEEIRKKFESFEKDYDGRITIGSIYHIAEMYGWKKPLVKFWFKENGRVKISRIRFKKFLESEGFCKYKIETGVTGSNNIFVRIVNNIVEEIDSIYVKEFVLNFLEQLAVEEFEGTNRNEIIDSLIKAAHKIFNQQFLEFLVTRNIEFNKDSYNKGYIYFKNGFVEVTRLRSSDNAAAGITFYNHKELKKCIWKKQIINRKYISSNGRSVFEDFLFNVCRNDRKRYEALKSGIGYLLHTYKDPSLGKAVVFIDEKLSEGAFGRSGKGLVIKAISHMRNVVVEEGRNFNPSKNFAFQRVKADTNIIGFEDIREKFPFERLFSIITDGITIERKNKDEIHIGYDESPKVVISTNYSIRGIDDSTIDRQFIIEFSDYYNKSHRPVDDFGKPFFVNWTEEEWNNFDNLMIGCLQLYLNKGLIVYEFVNLDKKKLIDETCHEFVEFAEVIIPNKEYEKKGLYENFKKEYDDYDSPDGNGILTQSKFTRWLKVYGKIEGYKVEERKSGSVRRIVFKEGLL